MANLKAEFRPITPWVEFTLDIRPELLNPPSIKVKIAHSSLDEIQDHVGPGAPTKTSAKMREVIADAIVDWDLQLNGEAVPCTPENKTKYLKFFVGLRVVAIDGVAVEPNVYPVVNLFGGQVLAYSSDPENFLKN